MTNLQNENLFFRLNTDFEAEAFKYNNHKNVYSHTYVQVPRALRQSAAPVEVLPRGAQPEPSLAHEYGARVPMGSTEPQLQVRV